MPDRVRKFVSREFIKTVDLDLFRRFLKVFPDMAGIDWDGLPDGEQEKREALFELFQRSENFPVELQNALHCARILAGDAGVSRLLELAEVEGVEIVPTVDAAEDGGEGKIDARSLVMRAFINHRDLFDKAVDLTRIWSVSRPLERQGAQSGIISRHDDFVWKEQFRAAVSAYFCKKYCGRYCDVRWHPEGEEINILVSHGKHVRTANVEERGEERALPFREIAEDTIRYSRRNGWLKVGAASVRDAKKLVDLFAEFLIGDEKFFAGPFSDELYTLDPIVEAGVNYEFKYGWDRTVTKVTISEVTLDDGGLVGRRRRSPWGGKIWDEENALARLPKLGIDPQGRHLGIASAKIDFHLKDGTRETKVQVNLQPPNGASFRDHSFEDVIFSHLERNGLRRGPRLDPSALAAE